MRRFLGRASPEPLSGNFTLLEVGQQVGTPEGLGTVTYVGLQGLATNGVLELDVPKVLVQLQESGEEKQFCVCELELHNTEHNDLLKKELPRLWPPLPEEPAKPEHEADLDPSVALPRAFKAVLVTAQREEHHRLLAVEAEALEHHATAVHTVKDLTAYLQRCAVVLRVRPRLYLSSLITAAVLEHPRQRALFERVERSITLP